MATEPRIADAQMDLASLYREEIYTDRKIGTMRVLVPVTSTGTEDASRARIFQGEAQLMTNVGTAAHQLRHPGDEPGRGGCGLRRGRAGRRGARDARNPANAPRSTIVDRHTGFGAALPPAGGGKIQLR